MVSAESIPQHVASFEGTYDVPEAARYIRASTDRVLSSPANSRKIYRWFRSSMPSSGTGRTSSSELFLSFEELISMRVVNALRNAGISLSVINQAQRWLQNETGIERPFATEFLWTGQGEVFAEWSEDMVSIGRFGQMAFDFLQDYLTKVDDLGFNESTGMANQWEPQQGIVLEPQVQFGTPCIKGTRIPTRTLSGMVEAGDSVEWVAAAFGLSQQEVQVACDWEIRLRTA